MPIPPARLQSPPTGSGHRPVPSQQQVPEKPGHPTATQEVEEEQGLQHARPLPQFPPRGCRRERNRSTRL